ncbi:MAG: precorrin-2 C(20)-methyltransferase [Clostridium sp.]|nr:precorrin-2 C(20)-methyltransferase [Clostridium sp.]
MAFLTLGDPCVYSTYIYIHKLIKSAGYETEIVSGVPSFCAAAARINEGLVEKSEELHIIPASYQIEESLDFSGTKVLMKSGKKISSVKEKIKEKNLNAVMVENCGMENEKVYMDIDSINEDASYYSLIIVKEK